MDSDGRNSVVDIGTRYGLDGRCSKTGVGQTFRNRPDRPRGPSSRLQNGNWASLPWYSGRGVALTTYALLAPMLCMATAKLLPTLCTFMACYRVTFTFMNGQRI